MQSGYCQVNIASKVDGSALSNTTTATSLLPLGALWTFPTEWFAQPGNSVLVRASGRISTLATSPGTLTLDLRLGAVVVATSQAFVLSTTAKTNVSWYLEWLLTLRATGGGTAANFMHEGVITSEALGATTVAGEAKSMCLQGSAPAVGTGFDETAANKLDFFGKWSAASASNSIQAHMFIPISLGAP